MPSLSLYHIFATLPAITEVYGVNLSPTLEWDWQDGLLFFQWK